MTWSLFRGSEIDSPRMAVGLVLTALLFLSLQDGLVKFASASSSLWQFQILRSIANLGLIAIGLGIARQWTLVWPANPVAVAFRTLAIMGTMIFFFSGAPFLTLSEMGAGLYTYPIFMTLLSLIFLGEKVGIWRFAAIAIAATGALLIIRPFSHAFNPAQLLPIGAGLCYAINAIILRKYCRRESPVTMAFWASGGFLAISIFGLALVATLPIDAATRDSWPFLLSIWPSVGLALLGLSLLCAICNVTGNLLIVKAYQSAEISGLAPVDYSYLIFATIWGLVLFSDFPSTSTVIGMILISAAGILTALRQRRTTSPLSFTNP